MIGGNRWSMDCGSGDWGGCSCWGRKHTTGYYIRAMDRLIMWCLLYFTVDSRCLHIQSGSLGRRQIWRSFSQCHSQATWVILSWLVFVTISPFFVCHLPKQQPNLLPIMWFVWYSICGSNTKYNHGQIQRTSVQYTLQIRFHGGRTHGISQHFWKPPNHHQYPTTYQWSPRYWICTGITW